MLFIFLFFFSCSHNTMNAYELQALRHIFTMTIDECATWIALTGDSEGWQQWENGKQLFPTKSLKNCCQCVSEEKNTFMPS